MGNNIISCRSVRTLLTFYWKRKREISETVRKWPPTKSTSKQYASITNMAFVNLETSVEIIMKSSFVVSVTVWGKVVQNDTLGAADTTVCMVIASLVQAVVICTLFKTTLWKYKT